MKKLQQKIKEVRETMAEEKEKLTARMPMRSKPFVLILVGILVAVGMVSSFFLPYSTVTAAAAEGSSVSDSAVTPEFKETMDSYETFVNGYVDFMKRYANAGSDEMVSMLSDYNDLMSQYADWVKKIDAIDSDSLSAADLAYYLEVVARTTAKLAEVSESDSSTSSTTTVVVASGTSDTTTVADTSSSFGTRTNSVSQTADVGICAVVLGAVATAALAMGAVTITRRKK